MISDTIGSYTGNGQQDHLPSSTSMTVDLSDGYSFPTHIAATDLRPDIVWWSEDIYTGGANDLLWNFLGSSNHKKRRPVPWPDWWNAEGRIHIHSDHGRGGIKRPSSVPEAPWHPQVTPPRILQTATGHITTSHLRIVQESLVVTMSVAFKSVAAVAKLVVLSGGLWRFYSSWGYTFGVSFHTHLLLKVVSLLW